MAQRPQGCLSEPRPIASVGAMTHSRQRTPLLLLSALILTLSALSFATPAGAAPSRTTTVTSHSTSGMVATGNKTIQAGLLTLMRKIPGLAKVQGRCFTFCVSRHDNRWGTAVSNSYAGTHRAACHYWDDAVGLAHHVPGKWVWTPGLVGGGSTVSDCLARFGKYPAPRAVKMDFCTW